MWAVLCDPPTYFYHRLIFPASFTPTSPRAVGTFPALGAFSDVRDWQALGTGQGMGTFPLSLVEIIKETFGDVLPSFFV